MPIIVLPILIALAIIALVPLSLIQRYRVGTSRRPARRWVATANIIAVALSTLLFLIGALVTGAWIPDARTYTLYGLAAGGVLGLIGLALTRWEQAGGRLHYTANRGLVLGITLLVTARILYGLWRTAAVWRAGVEDVAVTAAGSIAGSMSAGAIVLGYYLVFWIGVRRRIDAAPVE